MSRIFTDYNIPAKGIACEEYVAVCITPEGTASVYGEYPAYDDFAYFIQPNCDVLANEQYPEICQPHTPLTWANDREALYTYKVPGTADGNNYLELVNWSEGVGGEWQYWRVDAGELIEIQGKYPPCTNDINETYIGKNSTLIYPNPASDMLTIEFTEGLDPVNLRIISPQGVTAFEKRITRNGNLRIDTSLLATGLYIVETTYSNAEVPTEKLLLQD